MLELVRLAGGSAQIVRVLNAAVIPKQNDSAVSELGEACLARAVDQAVLGGAIGFPAVVTYPDNQVACLARVVLVAILWISEAERRTVNRERSLLPASRRRPGVPRVGRSRAGAAQPRQAQAARPIRRGTGRSAAAQTTPRPSGSPRSPWMRSSSRCRQRLG